MTGTQQITGTFHVQQLLALLITLLITGGATWAARRKLVIGKDGRLSTSKTIALLWTAVVAYCLVTLTLIAATDTNRGATFVTQRIEPLGGVYLALLGGPFGALIWAKVAVTSKVDSGRLQKPTAERASLADLTNNDEGRTDLIDVQYTIFNLVAIAYVLALFIPHPATTGLVDIPNQLAVLTGSSAAAYISNKSLIHNEAKITTITPRRRHVGETVLIKGENLWFPGTRPDITRVEVGGVDATLKEPPRDSETMEFIVPDPPAMNEPLDVRVVTNAGMSVEAPPADRLVVY